MRILWKTGILKMWILWKCEFRVLGKNHAKFFLDSKFHVSLLHKIAFWEFFILFQLFVYFCQLFVFFLNHPVDSKFYLVLFFRKLPGILHVKMRFWKCEFCGKWDFEHVIFWCLSKCEFCQKWDFLNVNFVEIEILKMWILWKMRFW